MKKVVTIIMIIVMTLSFSSVTMAADREGELQDQLNNTNEKLKEYEEKISDIADNIQDKQNKVIILQKNISSVDADIKDMQTKINDLQNKINITEQQLNAAIVEYNKQDDLMKKRISALYKNGTTVGYLEVILEATSFSDFITKADIMKKIVKYDMDMLKEMKQKREAIDKKKAELEQNKLELVGLKSNLDSKKKNLENQNRDLNNLVADLKKQKASYEASEQQEVATADKLKKDLTSLRSFKGNYDGKNYAILHKSDFPSGTVPVISSYFGYRSDPITGSQAYHAGLDIATRGYTNIPVYAMAPGKVILSEYYGGYGNTVVIDHGSGLVSLYAHNNTLLVSKGQMVVGGQKISLSGSTGRSTGPHVHFGVQLNGEYVNPEGYYLLGY